MTVAQPSARCSQPSDNTLETHKRENTGDGDIAASPDDKAVASGGGSSGWRSGEIIAGGTSGGRWTSVVAIHGACIAANDPFAGDDGRAPSGNGAGGNAPGGSSGDAAGGSGEADEGMRHAPYCPLRSSPAFAWSALTHPFRGPEAEAEAEAEAQAQGRGRVLGRRQEQQKKQVVMVKGLGSGGGGEVVEVDCCAASAVVMPERGVTVMMGRR
ncbi:hypothetical protein CLOP_g13395 [Closterium sp. NIES-67]|nr:hypothetical protein CLOP_g13395 [Closterium sp. NIES-67]